MYFQQIFYFILFYSDLTDTDIHNICNLMTQYSCDKLELIKYVGNSSLFFFFLIEFKFYFNQITNTLIVYQPITLHQMEL